MSISLDPLVMRFRTMSMSMYVPDRPTPSLRYTKFSYFYTANSNFENLYFREHSIAELDAGFFKYSFLIVFLQRFLRKRRLLLQFSLFLGKLTLNSHFNEFSRKMTKSLVLIGQEKHIFSKIVKQIFVLQIRSHRIHLLYSNSFHFWPV
jgi:hypothetical protein